MVPVFRLGLGPFLGNPLTGYIMVMKTIGRKSGKVYYVPVNYTIRQGKVYCASGGRRKSDWFRNLLANPQIEIILPSGAIFAWTEEVFDLEERIVVVRQLFKNAGVVGFVEGYNPWRISDEALKEKTADIPILSFTPIGIGNGASDPTGWAWITLTLITIAIIWGLVLFS